MTTDIENSTLFTRFAPPPVSSSAARQIQQFKALPPAFHFPSPPPSQKHSSLLSDILAVTRDSYQARKESSESNARDHDVAVPSTRAPGVMHTGRTYRNSVIIGRTGDPALQIIHEDEASSHPTPPLTSESLRELDRIVAERHDDGSGSLSPTHSTSLPNLGHHIADTRATIMVAAAAAPVTRIPARSQVHRHGSSDNLSLATTTTMRPSFHNTQSRSNGAGRNEESTIRRVITNQPSRAFIPLVPIRVEGHIRSANDELPEGTYSNSPGSNLMCVCFGRHLW